MTNDVAEIAAKLTKALAEYDASAADCPARKTTLGEKRCPKCRSGPSDGCGLEIGAAYAFVAAVRDHIRSQTDAG